MHVSQRDHRRSPCPQCGGAIRRIPRTDDDRRLALGAALRRYRCQAEGCAWEGLLPRQHSRRRRRHAPALALAAQAGAALSAVTAAAAPAAGTAATASAAIAASGAPAGAAPPATAAAGAAWRWWRLAPLLAAGLFGGALAAVLIKGLAGTPTPLTLAPGEHHEGVDLAASHPLLQAPESAGPQVQRLALKQGCAWALPGRSPYRGDVEQALVTARLPAEVVQRIALKVQAGQPDDRLQITNAAIRAQRDAREFDPRNVAMTYARTLCVNTRVNFKPGHSEAASLYEAADRQGRLHSVMVPDVCGNVSVLGVRMERRRAQVLPVLAEPANGSIPVLRTLWVDELAQGPVHRVPEAGTLAHVLAGLAAAVAVGRWQQRRGRRQGGPGETV